jgi:hypothetical protein
MQINLNLRKRNSVENFTIKNAVTVVKILQIAVYNTIL